MQALEQNTQEWLDFRKDKIGASDLPIILGISPYCTRYELWRQKVGFDSSQKETFAMTRGKELEPFIRESINARLEYNFTPEVVVHPNFEWAIASLDGIDEKRKGALEVKATSNVNHEMIRNGNCPDLFYPQIQWQMACGNLEFVVIAHFFGHEVIHSSFKRDDIYIENVLIPAAKDFYRCMSDYIAPEILEKDYIHIVDEDFGELASQWIEINSQMKDLKQKEDELKKKLIDLTDDGNCKGYGVVLKKKKRQGNIEWNKFWEEVSHKYPEAKEFNPESYRKEDSIFWELRAEKN